MVNSGQVIRQQRYHPPDPTRGQIEVMSFPALRRMNPGLTQRGDFFVLGLVRRGRGAVTADFCDYGLAPRTLALIAPGMVHRWGDIDEIEGELVLFVPTAPTPAAREVIDASIARCWSVPEPAWFLIQAAVKHLRLEIDHAERHDGIRNLLLSALLLRLEPPAPVDAGGNEIFQRFRGLVEKGFRDHHDVEFYAQALGYAPRTLSRAAHAATGRSAKAYLNERILLEAKRLLAHEGLSSARCADRLGFPDASNFSAFFRRGSGIRPGAWQSSQR
jgi:AraC-like DNA-binding protein